MMISRLNGGGGLLSSGCNAARRLFVGTMHNLAQGRGGGGEDNGVFGVVQIGSSQFKVSPDDLVFVEKLSDYQVNDKVCHASRRRRLKHLFFINITLTFWRAALLPRRLYFLMCFCYPPSESSSRQQTSKMCLSSCLHLGTFSKGDIFLR